ncbi:dTDP-4-dehydrorhamnose reductase [Pararhodobacter sp. SW119]|uniref:dTDP-4-dehydrorhamnose reductase n=1 Tax=Pararhodobacter sp. SW119 TaxID=2780075 RepID=UPI001ADEF401|nr:dTDP-4-dehydrorhamnose reductase [Pararhodobacter sp. SW119]
MRLLIFGQTGQVARELARALPSGWQADFLGRGRADLSDPMACAAVVSVTDAHAVINAAAYTAVDRAEEEEVLATNINGAAPAAMAREAAMRGLPFVQISTDYVFDGSGRQSRHPADPTGPLGAYGRSKLAGEDGVRTAAGPHAILRTSWVFSAHGSNFVKTMLRLGAERAELRVVADQVGGPTPAADIARACLTVAAALRTDPALSGTYHLAGAPPVSWADFARAIMAAAGLSCRITDIPTRDYPTPARRPLNSRLDGTTLKTAFGIDPPDWRAGLTAVVKELKGSRS